MLSISFYFLFLYAILLWYVDEQTLWLLMHCFSVYSSSVLLVHSRQNILCDVL